MGGLLGLALLVLAIIICGRVFSHEAARTWDARWPGTRAQAAVWARSRARSGLSSGATYARARWPGMRVPGWLPARVRGIVPGGDEPGGDDDDAPAGDDEPPAAASSRVVVPGTVVTEDPPAAPAPAAPVQSPTGRTDEVTTPAANGGTSALIVPGAEEMTAGMARLRAWAVAGNMEAKEAAFHALAEVYEQHADLIRALATSMQEDDKYGPEISEPVARMAPALSVLSTRAAEAESAVTSRLKMSGRDMIRSGYQAPERHQLSEAGSK